MLSDATPRLLSIGDVPPRAGIIPRRQIAEIRTWLGLTGGPASLWVHGPAGSGKTTTVAAAIREESPPTRSVKRVACFRGMCFEEVLEQAAQLFRQTGSELLSGVLRQRALARSKVAVLIEELRRTRVTLWIDDVDLLLPGLGGLESFLDSLGELTGGEGRVILTAQQSPPAGLNGGGDSISSISIDWESSPFAARWAFGNTADFSSALKPALEQALLRLSESALAVLQASCALPPEPSRQALREVAATLRVELVLRGPEEDPLLLELERHGLATLCPVGSGVDSASGPPLSVPAPLRDSLSETLRNSSPQLWSSLQSAVGTYFIRLGSKSGDLWHFVNGWRAFFAAGQHSTAYELQKVFVEELIQHGSIDLARFVLEETVRTSTGLRRAVALGNLAIIHKNCGALSEALKLYGQVRDELVALDDSANLARVLHQIGNTQYVMGDYDAATESYESSLELSSALGDRSVAAATRIQVANVYFMRGDRSRALEAYLDTLDDARVTEDHGLTAAVELQIGQIHLLEKRYMDADSHLREAERSAQASNDLRSLVKILEARGSVARERREYDEARAIYDRATEMAWSLGDATEAAAGLVLTGDLERDRLQLTEALRCYVRAQEAIGGRVAQAPGDASKLKRLVEERLGSLRETLGPQGFAKAEATVRSSQPRGLAEPLP